MKKEIVYYEGYHSFKYGQPCQENPYCREDDTEDYYLWLTGWETAQEDSMDNK